MFKMIKNNLVLLYLVKCFIVCNFICLYIESENIGVSNNSIEIIGKRETVDKYGVTHFTIYGSDSNSKEVSFEEYNKYNNGDSLELFDTSLKYMYKTSFCFLYCLLSWFIYLFSLRKEIIHAFKP